VVQGHLSDVHLARGYRPGRTTLGILLVKRPTVCTTRWALSC
jgi:hypothetical protein